MIHPNTLTVFRIILAFVVPPFLLAPGIGWRIGASCIFSIAVLTDFWDGYLARKTHQETAAGKILDPIADKLLNLGAMFTLASLHVYPLWAAVVITLREILLTAIRLKSLAKGEVLGAAFSGKLKTCVQIASLAIAYFCLMIRDYAPTFMARNMLFSFNYAVILATVAITLYSGYLYLKSGSRIYDLAELIATTFYIGCLPGAPGTYGSLAGLVLWMILPKAVPVQVLSILAVTAVGIWASNLHSKRTELKDPQEIVVDEVAGMLIALTLAPPGWMAVITGFFFFRLFDVLKPFPLRRLEHMKSGWGIVLDDIGAGVYANLLTQTLFRAVLG